MGGRSMSGPFGKPRGRLRALLGSGAAAVLLLSGAACIPVVEETAAPGAAEEEEQETEAAEEREPAPAESEAEDAAEDRAEESEDVEARDVETPEGTAEEDAEDRVDAQRQEPEVAADEEPVAGDVGPVAFGEPGTVGDWEVTVHGMETTGGYGDEFFEETAQGEFKVIDLTVANVGDESTTFDAEGVSLRDADGTVYSSHPTWADDELLYEQINPGNRISGKVVVDVPEDTEITAVLIEDTWSLSLEEPLEVVVE